MCFLFQSRLTRPLITFSLFETDLSFLGRYKNGKPNGNFWLRMIGGGFMHGKFNDDGSATGDNMSFIYPDMETALVGKFEDFVMKRAHEANVLDAKCDQDGLIIISKFANLSGPVFYYEAPTNESYGAGPYGINDPYERKSVQIAESSIPQSGEGVFAIRSFPAKRCSCYCSGFLYNYGSEMEGYLASCTNNETLSMDERRACKKYSVGMNFFNTVIDIPPEMDKPGMFQPTVGPKVMNDITLRICGLRSILHTWFNGYVAENWYWKNLDKSITQVHIMKPIANFLIMKVFVILINPFG